MPHHLDDQQEQAKTTFSDWVSDRRPDQSLVFPYQALSPKRLKVFVFEDIAIPGVRAWLAGGQMPHHVAPTTDYDVKNLLSMVEDRRRVRKQAQK